LGEVLQSHADTEGMLAASALVHRLERRLEPFLKDKEAG
jgi:hypothetical protein